jgi:small GTP-binding protein
MTGEFELLTSPGPAAIAVIRVHGPQAATFVERHLRTVAADPRVGRSFAGMPATGQNPTSGSGAGRYEATPESAAGWWQPGRVRRAELLDATGAAIDDILVSVDSGPPSWDLRLHLHGNPWLVRYCCDLLRDCRLEAEPEPAALLATEDALEAEALALLPRMPTLRGARWLLEQVGRLRAAIDWLLATEWADGVRQTCRDIAGRTDIVQWFARPLRVALAGPPNVGKSTLANALADRVACLTSPTPGTTRDWIEIPGEADGFPVIWMDTAGLRQGADPLETAAVEQSRQRIQEADAVVVVLDITDRGPPTTAFLGSFGHLPAACVALNKNDLGGSAEQWRGLLPPVWGQRLVTISATRRIGLDTLCQILLALDRPGASQGLAGAGRSAARLSQPAAFTARQARLLAEAADQSDRNLAQAKLLQLLSGSRPNPPEQSGRVAAQPGEAIP